MSNALLRKWLAANPDAVVERLIIDHAFTLDILAQRASLKIQIESNFTLRVRKQDKLMSIKDKMSLGDGLILFAKPLLSGEILAHGTLKLTFSEDIGLEVQADPDYEAWGLTLSDGNRAICMPGGQVAFWKT